MRRFWVADCAEGSEVVLSEAESRHAGRSLRLDEGAAVLLFDGRGREWEGVVSRRTEGRIEVRVGRAREATGGPGFTIATALPKGNRLDWMVEKLAELGATEILPVRFERSTVPMTDARRGRLDRIALAAAKQSGRATLPSIGDELDVKALQARLGPAACLASPSAERRLSAALPASLVVIGPEGGLTKQEEQALASAGARPVSLGASILRIETAAVAAAAILAQQ